MNDRILIAPAGWEDRYAGGVIHEISEFEPTQVIVPFSSRHYERTLESREKIKALCVLRGSLYQELEWNYDDHVDIFRSCLKLNTEYLGDECIVRLNSTTTPRNIIWYLLYVLSERKIKTQFSYYKPETYGSYLSRDALQPKLILKCSGISYPDRPTCIVALPGYDTPRLLQLRRWYEPKKMIIGVQTGTQFDNETRNVALIEECKLQLGPTASFIDFDSYDTSEGSVEALSRTIDQLQDEYNVVVTSLGPKPSSLTLFKLNRARPEIGLVYIGARDYDLEYCTGFSLAGRVLTDVQWQN